MKKIESVQEFVEKMDSAKKLNPKDLSSDQDLTIAIMNLISIEEHLIFSGAKTGKTNFYDLIAEVREMRKNLMLKIIPSYEGEVWCISKHLLASAMRLMEVGTKQQSMKNTQEAYKLFNQAYDLYCLFWGLNMNLINAGELKWVEDKPEDVKALSAKIEKNVSAASSGEEKQDAVAEAPAEQAEAPVPDTAVGKLKAFVRKAVNCCIE
jgi:hypothetical protein